jgi:hypothetical protein
MSQQQMSQRMREYIVSVGTYKLYGWKLVFDCGYNYMTFANIKKGEPTDFVEGVLYELTDSNFKELDMYERFYERVYFDLPEKGKDAFLCAYIGKVIAQYECPSIYYLRDCQKGALENNLNYTYNKLINYENNRDSRL